MAEGADTAKKDLKRCDLCGKEFLPRFSYQLQERDGVVVAFCSSRCQLKSITSRTESKCSSCGAEFTPEFAYQSALFDGKRVHFCSMECRTAGPERSKKIRRLAVYNLKGGTGKTTSAVSLAAMLAVRGLHVLLVDADPQGSVAVSLGVSARRGLYQILVLGIAPQSCVVKARENLDVILSDRTLAGAEVYLAGRPERHRVMRDRLASLTDYDLMVIDCSPSVGLLSQNALRCADSLLIPVSCDYLGVVGMEQAILTKNDLERRTGHAIKLIGILPTFHDGRLLFCRDAMESLRKGHGESLLPPIRINAKLREAPAKKSTILEHAPRSSGSVDYMDLAGWLIKHHLEDAAEQRSPHQ